ncbi:hypothetical protein [Luteibacter yeojuensis]|uniref:Uncharacterized protein n=1 Tax=Luteibacter yeojuensis TaxID=345309 RepID=A0A7X5QS62_9GAMM|nr:hypothetical protein [Luteibacter yeojuensis]NID14369.1 hypothetical protein [Luteibacter yeojuensis]
MKEQYMTLITPCNVAITMAEQGNNVDALLEAISLKLAVLAAAEAAPRGAGGRTLGDVVENMVRSSVMQAKGASSERGADGASSFGPHFGGVTPC